MHMFVVLVVKINALQTRVEFPIQLVGRLPHQLCFLPHQLYCLPHKFSIDFEVFRLRNEHVDPKLCCDIRV